MENERKWVIPDLHGCVKTLQALIENHIKPTKKDKLYFLGDYVDRNHNPKGVLDYLLNLENEGYRIFPLRGNHEEYLLMAYNAELKLKRRFLFGKEKNLVMDQWLRHGGSITLKSFGVKNIKEIPAKYIQWLNGLKYYYVEGDYVIVHAGMNFDRLDPFEDTHAMLWSGSFRPVPENIGHKTIIHGHVPVSLGFLENVLNNPESKVIALDNGCYLSGAKGMGNLTALELNTRRLVLQPCVD